MKFASICTTRTNWLIAFAWVGLLSTGVSVFVAHQMKSLRRAQTVAAPVGLPADAKARFEELKANTFFRKGLTWYHAPAPQDAVVVIDEPILRQEYQNYCFVRLKYFVRRYWWMPTQESVSLSPIAEGWAIPLKEGKSRRLRDPKEVIDFLAATGRRIRTIGDAERIEDILTGLSPIGFPCRHERVSSSEWRIGIRQEENGSCSYWKINVNGDGRIQSGDYYHRFHELRQQ